MPDPKQMSFMWDKRYGTEEYAYGKEANAFFSAQLERIVPGQLLLPGEGEGRNAVYAARKGWAVDAFDQSSVGQAKALVLASEISVEINYRVCRMEDFSFKQNHYDAVGLLFFHANPAGRIFLHRKVFESLKPGGVLILEAFHKEQLKNNTGGPKSPEMLFDEETLSSDFALFETLLLEKQDIVLNEGPFHQGAASVIRFIGKKSF
jgi:SAM-dependent methyltransferase